jgi:cob(I)alamin adenosyltransferase
MEQKYYKKTGLVYVLTGNGKGKTTSALGMILRSAGYKMKSCMIQFIKGSWHYGEKESWKLLKPHFTLVTGGKGFVGILDDKYPKSVHVKAAKETLKLAERYIKSGKYDIIVLDEINVAMQLKLLKVEDVLKVIKARPDKTSIILTGRGAPQKLIDYADLVSEVREIKHPYQKGILAKKGLDF